MAHLIHRHAVEHEKIVISVTAIDMKPGKQLRSAGHSGNVLKCLYNVRRTQKCKSPVESGAVKSFKSGLGTADLSVRIRSDKRSGKGVALLLY